MLFFSSTANTVSASALFENYNSKGTVFEGQCPPCNCVPAKTEQIWSWLVYFATTLEVLVRGFSLGFGARMLKYIFFPEESEKLEGTTDNLFEQFKRRAIVSMISGLSVAAFIHGSSLFIPTQLRDNWFDYVDQWSMPKYCTRIAIYLKCDLPYRWTLP